MSVPKTLGRYRILGEISRGAMGRVYLAHDPHIDRKLAIKTIHPVEGLPAAEAEENRRRFLREAQAAGRLQHPGIVTIHDVGVHEGISFIAMEFIEGDTLEAHTQPGRLLPLNRVVDFTIQACEALDYAHREKVVHRDIKPANLMILKDGRLKITDFGLAKNPSTTLTQDGTLMGTPNYMSPEQITGRPLDGRSDLFSLGAVIYELVTGARPFAGDSVTTIIYRILHEQPVRPDAARPTVPASLADVVMKALEKHPGNRFPTGADLAAALRPWAAQAPGAPEKAPAGDRVRSVLHAPGPGLDRPPEPRRAAGRPPRDAVGTEARPRSALWSLTVAAATLALVLLVPARTTSDDRWGRGGADGLPPFHQTASLLAGSAAPDRAPGAPAPPPSVPDVTVPGGVPTARVTLVTDPPGGTIYVDDMPIEGGMLVLPADDRATHTIVAENECFIEELDYRLGEDHEITIPLKTRKVGRLAVGSSPPGARISLDGRSTGQVTPATIPVTLCEDHRIRLTLEGHLDATAAVTDPADALNLTLEPIPMGFLIIESPYPVTLYDEGRRIGRQGEKIEMTAGKHAIRAVNEDLFVDRTLQVDLKRDATTRLGSGLPGLGGLTVLASPSNCTIFVNGREIGVPPINDFRLAEGTYTVRAVYVPTGESSEVQVTITAGGTRRVPFRFNP